MSSAASPIPEPVTPAALTALVPKPNVVIDSPYPQPQVECASLQTNEWWYEREWFCGIFQNITVTTIDLQTGGIDGEAFYTITHAGGLDPQGGTWSDWAAIDLTGSWGIAATIVGSNNTCSPCSGIQSGDPLRGQHTAQPNSPVSGANNLSDGPLPGSVDNGISVTWTDSFTCSGCTPGSTTFTFASLVRCDATYNTGSAVGCAIGSWTPQLALTGYSTGNTSTAFVSFIQSNNNDHWGKYPSGTTLTRLNNPSQASANRAAMCTGFISNPAVTNDSCDEFPFAATYQSGNMLGQTASQCSQVVPEWQSNTGQWAFIPYPGYLPTQRCGIGHVVLSDNQSVGGMYGAFIQNNRVIDGDAFWIGIFN